MVNQTFFLVYLCVQLGSSIILKKQMHRISEVRRKCRDCQTLADKPTLAKAARVPTGKGFQWEDRTHALGYVILDPPGRQETKGSSGCATS